MNHKELMQRTIALEATPSTPVAFWRHFPVDDQDFASLARSTIAFQEMFDFDFIKVSPASSFCIKDWGANDEWKGNPEGTRNYQGAIIQTPEDWVKIEPLNPTKGFLGAQLECLKSIKREIPTNTPIVQTVFSPLAQAKNLAGKKEFLAQIRQYPDLVKQGLTTITKTTQRFIDECQKIGIDGIFYAVQQASFDILSEVEFLDFGKSFDAQIFEYLQPFWMNVLHIHGSNIMFEKISDYPFQVFNWHDRETTPSLSKGKKKLNRAVCGGLSRINTMVLGLPKDIEDEFRDAKRQTGNRGLILGTGCVCPLTTPLGNIFRAVNLARNKCNE